MNCISAKTVNNDNLSVKLKVNYWDQSMPVVCRRESASNINCKVGSSLREPFIVNQRYFWYQLSKVSW